MTLGGIDDHPTTRTNHTFSERVGADLEDLEAAIS